MPYTDMDDPMRKKGLIDNEDPKQTKSSTDREEPSRAIP
jgi:hypothetical protein